ncbi:hypothetical protein LUZ63_001510 [Rhynchospora breviuscula]|uniref:Ribosomal protein L27 n=1 Tax=Rhynchospora breviuscula TaxID=2022672 RepID=A0A9Q0CX38_9POAL|nr:hypothetical protein LUZ63_001510 [Rhynchospora breviuscula]
MDGGRYRSGTDPGSDVRLTLAPLSLSLQKAPLVSLKHLPFYIGEWTSTHQVVSPESQAPTSGLISHFSAFISIYQVPNQEAKRLKSNLKVFIDAIYIMSFSTICRRVGLKDIVSNAPVYTSSTESVGGLNLLFKRWATKKTAGSTKNGRDSNPKYLGVKKFGGEKVIPGNIIVRQRGTRFHPGDYVGIGKDHTLFALKEGNVRFECNKLTGRKWVHVDPHEGHVLHPIYGSAETEAELC